MGGPMCNRVAIVVPCHRVVASNGKAASIQIGTLFVDLFPRPDKYNHAAVWSFRNVSINTIRSPFKWNSPNSGHLVYNNTILRTLAIGSWFWTSGGGWRDRLRPSCTRVGTCRERSRRARAPRRSAWR